MNLTQNQQKEMVGKSAVDKLIEDGFVFSGMKIALGTGSTALWAIRRLAEKIASGTLKNVYCTSTSYQTTMALEQLGIPVFSMTSPEINGELDLTIDGADEVDKDFNLIKGGGAALLNEKIAAYNSKKYVIVTDESKIVSDLGTKFPLPVEIIASARISVIRELEKLGAKRILLRDGVKKCGPVITDNGNQILDCVWQSENGKSPVNPSEMEKAINSIVGVVENGFFTNKPAVFVAHSDGALEILNY